MCSSVLHNTKRVLRSLKEFMRATKLVKSLVGMSCEEKLRTCGLSSQAKRRLKDLTALHNFLKREAQIEVLHFAPGNE